MAVLCENTPYRYLTILLWFIFSGSVSFRFLRILPLSLYFHFTLSYLLLSRLNLDFVHSCQSTVYPGIPTSSDSSPTWMPLSVLAVHFASGALQQSTGVHCGSVPVVLRRFSLFHGHSSLHKHNCPHRAPETGKWPIGCFRCETQICATAQLAGNWRTLTRNNQNFKGFPE